MNRLNVTECEGAAKRRGGLLRDRACRWRRRWSRRWDMSRCSASIPVGQSDLAEKPLAFSAPSQVIFIYNIPSLSVSVWLWSLNSISVPIRRPAKGKEIAPAASPQSAQCSAITPNPTLLRRSVYTGRPEMGRPNSAVNTQTGKQRVIDSA